MYINLLCEIVKEIEFGICLLRDKKGFDVCLYKYKVSSWQEFKIEKN